ncbi:Sim1p [Coccidioides immitis H538.4]|uniref:Sim1p n=2 Tax=Coccidioides immitis TaxID=5501 RepID=A0A0J8RCQ3_COCIT|nr:Sim1p [Coccidioides immitis RMSCC 2394]KMU82662.1 Sim1p [Coccidioides immitis H538.4]
MKSHSVLSRAWTLILLFASVSQAGHRHGHGHGHSHIHGGVVNAPKDGFGLKHHHFHHRAATSPVQKPHGVARSKPLKKRGGQCEFPSDAGLVAVTPNEENAGWAMSPDQPCEPGNYCPYACPPGMVMAQWDPKATSYTYPQSMNGGLYCDDDGKISKPFPSKPYCVEASGPVVAKNDAGGVVSFCQTVLPGNEAMLIPTSVDGSAKLAVPDPDYWCSTAAHYYINPPGKDTETACVWGTKDHPWGNWAPYVAGANMDSKGQTFLKIGWNPIYLEPETPFRDESPSFGVKIECDGDGCNGLPCQIDPAKNSINEVTGSTEEGAGGASFCVVTVPKGGKANVVVFEAGKGSNGGSEDDDDDDDDEGEDGDKYDDDDEVPETTTSAPEPTPTTDEATSSTPAQTTTSIVSSTSSSEETTSTIASTTSAKSSIVTAHNYKAVTVSPHVFVENPSSTFFRASNSTTAISSATLPPTASSPPVGGASATSLSIMSLTASFILVSLFLSF